MTQTATRHSTTRTILKAMGMFGSVKALSLLCSLVRNKLIAVWVGAPGVGLVILYNSLVDMIATFSRLNIDQSAMREVARAREADIPVIGTVVTRWSRWLGIAGGLLMCALSPWLSELSFGTADKWWQFCLLGTTPFFGAMVCAYTTVLQGTRQFTRLARTTLLTSLLGIAASVPLIWYLRYDSIIWLIITYSVLAFVATYALRQRLPRIHLTFKQVWHQGGEFIRLGIFMTVALGITQLLQWLFVLYLNHYASTAVLGLYQAGYTVINSYIGVFFTGIWIEYYPRLSALIHSRRSTRLAVSHEIITCNLIIMPVTAALIACDSLIVRVLYAESFEPMLPFITIGMAGVSLRATSWCLAHVILAKGDGRTYLVTESVSAAAMIALNIAGYHYGGYAGLGMAYVVWYALYTLITMLVYTRRYRLTLTRTAWLMAAGGFLFAALCVGAKLLLGWWAVALLGIAVLPSTLKQLLIPNS